MTPFYVKGTLVVFWGEKNPWLGCYGPKRDISMPRFELRFCPGHWGGLFCPILCEPSSYIVWTWFASKKSHSRTFAQMTPSASLIIQTTPVISDVLIRCISNFRPYIRYGYGTVREIGRPYKLAWPPVLRRVPARHSKFSSQQLSLYYTYNQGMKQRWIESQHKRGKGRLWGRPACPTPKAAAATTAAAAMEVNYMLMDLFGPF